MRERNVLSALVLCLSTLACEPSVSIELEARTQSLQVNAAITSIEFDIDEGKAIYRAAATVSNMTDEAQHYSNMWLWLESGNSLKSRAYLDSLSSHYVEIGSIEVGPNERLHLDIYWVFPSSEIAEPSISAQRL